MYQLFNVVVIKAIFKLLVVVTITNSNCRNNWHNSHKTSINNKNNNDIDIDIDEDNNKKKLRQ